MRSPSLPLQGGRIELPLQQLPDGAALTPPLEKEGSGLRIKLRGGTAVAIVPNYKIVFLVFICFYWFFLRPLRGINSHR